MSDTTDGSLTLRKDDMRFDQYKEFIRTYRHHVDLYVKAGAIFLAMIGTAFGFAFGGNASLRLTAAMMLFVAGASIAWISGAYFTGKWLEVMGGAHEQSRRGPQTAGVSDRGVSDVRSSHGVHLRFARDWLHWLSALRLGSAGRMRSGQGADPPQVMETFSAVEQPQFQRLGVGYGVTRAPFATRVVKKPLN